jgi:hypothetical protein
VKTLQHRKTRSKTRSHDHFAMAVHVALVDATGTVSAADLARVAGAQPASPVSDFAPVWHGAATVGAYPEVPPHTWRLEMSRGGEPGGVPDHRDQRRGADRGEAP